MLLLDGFKCNSAGLTAEVACIALYKRFEMFIQMQDKSQNNKNSPVTYIFP